jgi:hypothetical protein
LFSSGWGQKTDGVVGIDGYTRNSGCGNACGRPYFRWDNGPQGFGDGSPAGNSTQWPSSLNIGATFDPVRGERPCFWLSLPTIELPRRIERNVASVFRSLSR